MASFNLFSQFEPFIREKLDSRIGKPEVVSKLNTWVRLFSSKYNENDENGPGLILVSNPDYKLFRAAGDSTVSTIYGGGTQSGVIGVSWSGKPIYDEGGVGLRPSPVVTSIEVDEGMSETLSRKATITIKAFTPQQMEKITEYFLEPGFTVFFEWGWNTRDAARQIQSFGKDADTVLNYIRDTNNFTKLMERRANSNGDYDSYLGYIIGGNVSTSETSWDITVELSGLPEIPFYLRANKTQEIVNSNGERKTENPKPKNLFRSIDISKETNEIKKRAMRFYNDLPENLQINNIREWVESLDNDALLLNFDGTSRDRLQNAISGKRVQSKNFINSTPNRVYLSVKFPSKDNISVDRYVKMDVVFELIKILIKTFADDIKDTQNIIDIDISDTVISAFPQIFSTDGKLLFIPNPNTPKYTIGTMFGDRSIDIKNAEFMDNSISNKFITFPSQTPLSYNPNTNRFVPIGPPNETFTSIKDAQNWGYLKNLYVNFDFMKRVLSTKNFTLGDVVKNLLNGVSKAVNNYWNFQIIEDIDNQSGILKLKIIDQNFSPNYNNTESTEYTFTNIGEKSIFMNSSFGLDIGGAMTNRIIGQRLSNNANSNEPQTGLFSIGSNDKVLQSTQTENKQEETDDTSTETNESSTDIDFNEELSLYFDKINMIPKPEFNQPNWINRFGNLFFGKSGANTQLGVPIEEAVLFTSFNDVELFESFHFVDELDNTQEHTNKVSPLLPIKFSFTIHGISGIRRFDVFKVIGIPPQYEMGGFFQVTSIKQSIQDMKWSTTVEGQFRNKLNPNFKQS